jgi:14-3-3 protein epsilon
MDMLYYIKKVVEVSEGAEFNSEERNLLSVAYKNIISPKRNALRIFWSLKNNPNSKNMEKVIDWYIGLVHTVLIFLKNLKFKN